MKKRILSMLLCALMCTSLMAACGDSSETPAPQDQGQSDDNAAVDSTETTEETEIVYSASIPEGTDYGGYEFRFLHWAHTDWAERMNKDLVAEESNGEVINDAVYDRNQKVSELLNVTFSAANENLSSIASRVNRSVQAGEDAFDAVYVRLYEVPSLLTGGVFVNLNDVPTIDLTQPWWDQASVEQLSIDNKLFLVASDINIIDKNATAGLAFNKGMAESYNIPDCYQLVRDGKWTIDQMLEIYSGVSQDINGDGIMDQNDIYGFLSKNDALTSFFHGGGGMFVGKDENDIPVFSFMNDHNISLVQKILDMANDTNNFFNQHVFGTSVITDQMYTQLFEEGHGLFFWLRLDDIEMMRSSDTDFGVIPTPKYDEAQENYYSTVSVHTTGLLSVPKTVADIEKIGMILEVLSAESKNTVQPAYYEVAMTTKYTRDVESGEMLELIMQNRVYDLGCVYGFGDFSNKYQEMVTDKAGDITSLYASYEDKVNAAIEKVVTTFSELG